MLRESTVYFCREKQTLWILRAVLDLMIQHVFTLLHKKQLYSCCILWEKRRALIAVFGMSSIPQKGSLSHIRDIIVCPLDWYFNRPLSQGILEAIHVQLKVGLMLFLTEQLYKSLVYFINVVCLINRQWILSFNLLKSVYKGI